ncbi:MAG: LysE family translocator [Alphaproteobacteria bacterium]|jgi:threonine/homoserine/homoserine lactone efflux protein
MDTAQFFLKGLIVGFLVAAPVGPVAIMCMQRTIVHGKGAGYVCGLGAALADTVIGAIAALGLGFMADQIAASQGWLQMIGGTIVIIMGLKLLLSAALKIKTQNDLGIVHKFNSHLGNFVTAFALMITNPITIVSFAAIFAAINIGHIGTHPLWGAALVGGIFVGGLLWWTVLVSISSLLRKRINARAKEDPNGQMILWINRCTGGLLLGFGVLLLVW